jgi:hypothetical protein
VQIICSGFTTAHLGYCGITPYILACAPYNIN